MADTNPFKGLQEGLAQFNAGVKELQLRRALDAANQRVNEIKSVETNERKQRAGLQQVANDLVMQMTGLGADAASMKMAYSALAPEAPQQYQSIQQAFLSDDPSAQKKAKDLMKIEQENTLAKVREQNLGELQKAALTQAGKQTAPKASSAEKTFEVNYETAIDLANDLKNTIKKSGTFEAWDEKSAADLQGAAYKLAINYAKIVDPDSVAREGEVAAAQKYLIPLGMFTREKTAQAAIDNYIKDIERRKQVRDNIKSRESSEAPFSPTQNSTQDWTKFRK